MNRPTLALAILAAVVTGAVVVSTLSDSSEPPVLRWSAGDEVESRILEADQQGGELAGGNGYERSLVEPGDPAADRMEERVDVRLRGRVVDKFSQPVRGARVWLEFGRGGRGPGARQRRVPEPVVSDQEGRFAFEGQAFRTLNVLLQVRHDRHAPGVFNKDLGTVDGTADLGDLVLRTGGQVRGRVTDLDGNGIAAAEIRLSPENRNQLRWWGNRDELLPPVSTDRNGFYLLPHVSADEWTITAKATRHLEARSPLFAVEDDQTTEVQDLRLGPGFEIVGVVRTELGTPIGNADVSLRPAGGSGSEGGWEELMRSRMTARGREHRTQTDAQGRFQFDHLPGVALRLEVQADGFLDHEEEGIDPQSGQTLAVTLQEGLKITGVVIDPDGSPVTSYAVQAVRLRGLGSGGQPAMDINELVQRFSSGNGGMDASALNELQGEARQLMRTVEQQARDWRRGGRDAGPADANSGGRGRPGNRDPGRPEPHPDGTFVVAGLQEGIYEVHVRSPAHAPLQSAEITLRRGPTAPHVKLVADPGFFVAGVVLDQRGGPVSGAQMELTSSGDVNPMAWFAGGRDGISNLPDLNRLARDGMRMVAGARRSYETRTDAEGVFVFKHVAGGSYRVEASARNFASATTEVFELTGDRSGLELRLGLLGSIAGSVRELRTGEHGQARVAAVRFIDPGAGGFGTGFGGMFRMGRGGNQSFQNVEVAPDGSYRIEGLTPGDYIVRSYIGSPQQLMRELGPQFFAGKVVADVSVRGGEESRFDVAVLRPQVGSVAGSVQLNGSPGSGLRVELRRRDGGPEVAVVGGGQRRMAEMGRSMDFWRSPQATVAASGRFQIPDVPAGSYEATVLSGSGARSAPLHQESVQIATGSALNLDINIWTAALRGTATHPAGGDSEPLNGRVLLLPGVDTMPANLAEWQRGNRFFETRLQNGSFAFDAIPRGNYLLVLAPRNRERTSSPVTCSGDQQITVTAGRVVLGGRSDDSGR